VKRRASALGGVIATFLLTGCQDDDEIDQLQMIDRVSDAAKRDGRTRDAEMDASADRDVAPGCDPPPEFAPDAPCACLSFGAAAESYEIWIDDPNAQAGGYRIDLPLDAATTVGGHSYANRGAGSTSCTAAGLVGDAIIEVDAPSTELRFHFEGCVVPTGEATWDFRASLTRTNPLCPRCEPARVGRHYSIVYEPRDAAKGTYVFTADEPPRPCGAGADLLKFVHPG
jgi:hypothetical protein